jgi:S1-C subfamily serine protease
VLLLLALVCVGAGSGAAAWRLNAAHSRAKPSPAAALLPGSAASPSASASSVAVVDQAIVDINATLAGGGAVAGTGMVISSSGELLTNNHVIEGTSSISVQIDGAGPVYAAHVVGVDPTADVALLQVEHVSGLATVAVGDPSTLSVGQAVTALGNALGQGGTPAAAPGVISALGQTITASDETGSSETLSGMIQVDAAIKPGDSGGPVIDAAGHVVGMTTAGSQNGRFSTQFTAATAGFAIPIDSAMSIVRQIQHGGGGSADIRIGSGPLLGVEIDTRTLSGAVVVGVTSGGPAQAAGIAAGDTITAVAGQAVGSPAALRAILQRHSPGAQVTVVWITASGAQRTARIVLAAGPPV